MPRKQRLEAAMQGLYEHFAARGWTLQVRSPRHLWLAVEPGSGVRHEMLLHESGVAKNPPPGFFACCCSVDIRFPPLEPIVKPSLGYAAQDRIIALFRSLNSFMPLDQMFDGDAHLVEIDPASGTAARQRFLDDIDRYLEPVRKQFDDIAILADPDFIPHFSNAVHWAIWRAPYLKSTLGEQEWRAYADQLEAAARAVLAGAEQNASGDPKIFTSIAELVRDTSVYSAECVLAVLASLR